MHLHRFSPLTAALVILSSGSALVRAQSLADVAKKEEERRKTVSQPAKVYTNKDLNPVPGGSAAPAAAKDAGKDSKDAAAKDAKDGDGKDGAAKDQKDQKYWTDKIKALREQPEAQAALRASHPAVVLSDLRLTNGDGFGVLRAAKELEPELPVIVMTAFGSIQDAVAAMKEGALDFLAKPVDPDHLLLLVERALIQRRMVTENLILKEELARRRGAPQIVGDDAKLKQVPVALNRAAPTDTTALREGE